MKNFARLKLIVIYVCLSSLILGVSARGTSITPERIILTWENNPSSTQAVCWRTMAPCPKPMGQVCLPTEDPKCIDEAQTVTGSTSSLSLDACTAYYHEVIFTGLAPDTEYMYRVGDGNVWSEWNIFRTASLDPTPFRFVYLGDAQNNIHSMWSRCVRSAYRHCPDARFFLYSGDLVAEGYDDALWGEWFDALGFLARTVPTIPAPGNHDLHRHPDSPAPEQVKEVPALWRAQFALPQNHPREVPFLSEASYYLDYQGVRIIAIDSNPFANDDFDPASRDQARSALVEWLDRVLSDSSATFNIVVHHHPLYSTGKDRDNRELREFLLPLYDKYHVDLVLQGHDHHYGRSHKLFNNDRVSPEAKGTVYIVSVSGPKMYTQNPKFEALMAVMRGNTQAFQVFEVENDRLKYKAYSVTGECIDAFELHKNADASTRLVCPDAEQ